MEYNPLAVFVCVKDDPMAYDVIVVGGGHNGLTCACYLQKAG